MQHLNRGWLRLIGVVLLVALVLLFKIDLGRTAALVLRADPLDVGLALVFFIPFLAVKAWRWQVILDDLGIRIPYSEALRLYALGLGAGMVTPGQVGDAVKVAYLRERGLGRTLISVVLDRLWDVLILLLLAGSGALLFYRQLEGEWLALALLIAGTLVLLAVIVNPAAQKKLFELWLRARKARPGTNGAAYQPIQLTAIQILRQFGLTVAATAVVYARYYLLTAALGIHLDPIPFVATMSLATVAALLPISVAGLGARDAALLLVAPLIGITSEQAVGLSTLILFLSIVNGIVGLVIWLVQSGSWKLDVGGRKLEAANPESLSLWERVRVRARGRTAKTPPLHSSSLPKRESKRTP